MIINIEDLRKRARRRLPRAVFDYIDGAAEDELTARRNREYFQRLLFDARVLVDVSTIDQSVSVFGQKLTTPIILAPTGLCGMATNRGEVLAARAASRTGSVFTLSSMAAVSIEDVAREAPGPHWFQLYVWRNRDLTRALVERAQAAGYKALMLTVDVPIASQRERDLRNGATIPPRITIRNALDSAMKLGWLLRMARDPWIDFANLKESGIGARAAGGVALGSYVNAQFDPSLDWDDLAELRKQWTGPLMLKGVMSAEDARRAIDYGVEGIVVSNHGGRQLDSLPASIEVLPEIADAVGDQIEVLFDGGIRRGSDIVKAIALGAKACLIGRPYLYGLGAGGQAGAEKAITILQSEIARALALLGRPSLASLDRSALRASNER
jgi:isopentenyl diphosphate isomerase/L-lactate dehydrogenase-like FMN-dependent dehydrogenase